MIDSGLRLPNGKMFDNWEVDNDYKKILYVDINSKVSSHEENGSERYPFTTINQAAQVAEPGTKVIIREGVYREWVRPRAGGIGPSEMIAYEAYPNEEVIIKASEIVENFKESKGWRRFSMEDEWENIDVSIWQIDLKPEWFQGYNPFCAVNILHDRLFIEYDKTDMTTYLNRRGMVFVNNKPLKQVQLYNQLTKNQGSYWVESNGQRLHIRLEDGLNPEEQIIEVTCREQCFAPEIPFLSYIKVKGITCAHAANGGPVPQRGSLSCYRGHHWIIEDCIIDWANTVGIDIGNECWHHEWTEGQIIGFTHIRRTSVYNAGVCGIAGLFAKNILIEDNLIEGTGWQHMELSWEAAGIKIHDCSDSIFRRNVFTKTYWADHLWLDMFNENNRISQNLFLDGIKQREAIFIECSRDDINLIDNNIFWNVEGRFEEDQLKAEKGSGGWYKLGDETISNGYAIYGEGTDRLNIVNNFIGKCRNSGYFAKTVSFRIVGHTRGGTSRLASIRNNMFYDCQVAAIKFPTKDNEAEGNIYLNMPGGYLRILFPQPEECLDLPAWQEFHQFDLSGQEGFLTVDIDTEAYTMTIQSMESLPFYAGAFSRKKNYVRAISDINKVDAREAANLDFWGKASESKRLPGPFQEIVSGQTFSIDPRK